MNKDLTTHVGMDVHKKEHVVGMLLPGEGEPEVWTVPNDWRGLGRMVRRILKAAPDLLEAMMGKGFALMGLERVDEALQLPGFAARLKELV